MKTSTEIIQGYPALAKTFSLEDETLWIAKCLSEYLTIEEAVQMLGLPPEARARFDPAKWVRHPLSASQVALDMRGYLRDHIWAELLKHHPVCCAEGLALCKGWLWLLEDQEALSWTEGIADYAPLGGPKFAKIAARYQVPVPKEPRLERMLRGMPCQANCLLCMTSIQTGQEAQKEGL